MLVAKVLCHRFFDTDARMQAREGRPLQNIIDAEGRHGFCQIEARHVLSLNCRGCVIATGGSVVYSERAMKELKSHGVVVYLRLPLFLLRKRLIDLESRGVVMAPGQTLRGLFRERQPLYERYADIIIDCADRADEQVVADIIAGLEAQGVKCSDDR